MEKNIHPKDYTFEQLLFTLKGLDTPEKDRTMCYIRSINPTTAGTVLSDQTKKTLIEIYTYYLICTIQLIPTTWDTEKKHSAKKILREYDKPLSHACKQLLQIIDLP